MASQSSHSNLANRQSTSALPRWGVVPVLQYQHLTTQSDVEIAETAARIAAGKCRARANVRATLEAPGHGSPGLFRTSSQAEYAQTWPAAPALEPIFVPPPTPPPPLVDPDLVYMMTMMQLQLDEMQKEMPRVRHEIRCDVAEIRADCAEVSSTLSPSTLSCALISLKSRFC